MKTEKRDVSLHVMGAAAAILRRLKIAAFPDKIGDLIQDAVDAELANSDDAKLIDWMARAFNEECEFRPSIRGYKDGSFVIWNQKDGLNKISEGSSLREALDAAKIKYPLK